MNPPTREPGANDPAAPQPLWQPSAERVAATQLTRFHQWVATRYGAPTPTGDDPVADYAALHHWSVREREQFWSALTTWYEVDFHSPPDEVLVDTGMPGAQWFPGARLNYAEHLLRHADAPEAADQPAIRSLDERFEAHELSWDELRQRVAALAEELRALGVRPGDYVGAYLPNIPQAVVALLASAAVGAVWTSCSPDFGARGVLDRLSQVEPVVLFTVDGYQYGGKTHDRRDVVSEIRGELPSLRATVHVSLLDTSAPTGALDFDELTLERPGSTRPTRPRYEHVPFEHPLWVLYSSGTTGLPKAIVQSQGGILVEHLKQLGLHFDLGPRDRFFWYTSTGWMMWNVQVAGLLTGSTIVLYDGSPGYPSLDAQWRVAEQTGVTVLGTSAAYVMSCQKKGLRPGAERDLSQLRCVATTGSPLPPDGFAWIHDAVGPNIWPASVSGGTDVCSIFVGGVPTLPVYIGEIQAPSLGAAVEAWQEVPDQPGTGVPVTDEVGELVVTAPIPSMPLFFVNDQDGERYRESYFEMFPGVWRHGDWITRTSRGTVVIHGRSDSTLNRHGVRMGSADIYEAVERLPEITESLVVGVEQADGGYWMPLFVHLAPDTELDDTLRQRIRDVIRKDVSPRHVPDEVLAVPALPHTRTGKRIEVPVKKLLQGRAMEQAVNAGSVDDPEALRWFAHLAEVRHTG